MVSSEPNSDEFIQKSVVNPVGECPAVNSYLFFEKAKKHHEDQQKAFQEKYKEYEPYDLSEINNIISEVKKKTKKDKPEHKLMAYGIALNRINLIIHNSELIREILEREGSFDAHDYYYDELDKASNSKIKFEMEIDDVILEAAKQTKPNEKDENAVAITKPKADNPLEAGSPTSKPETAEEPHVSTKKAAEHLKLHPSTLYHKHDEDIPRFRIGRTVRYKLSDLDKWSKAENKDEFMKGYLQTLRQVDPKSVDTKKETKKKLFTFTIPLEPLTNVLAEDEKYLDKDNAALMNARFSKEDSQQRDHIQWKGDLLSLITFIYLADRLGYIDKSKPRTTRKHKTSSREKKEEGDEGKEIQYQKLLLENFKIPVGQSFDKARFPDVWIGVNCAIYDLRKKVAEKKGTKLEKAHEEYTRKEAIEYYFRAKFDIPDEPIVNPELIDVMTFYECIDKNMLEIVQEIWEENRKHI